MDRDPIIIFWELTLSCALACSHCRAEAQPQRHPLEMDTQSCFRLLEQLTGFDQPPIVVLSGGDPFMRRDLFNIVDHAVGLGLTVSVSPSATALVTRDRLRRLADAGVSRVSFSLDGATQETHDSFRGFPGTFRRTMDMFQTARDVGLEFQINTTVTRSTVAELPALAQLVSHTGAVLWDLFFLVPVGRGNADDLMSGDQHEAVFNWIVDHRRTWPFQVKTTLGQHYRRVAIQRRLAAEGRSLSTLSRADVKRMWPLPATNDGRGIFFISHTGTMMPSGFLPIPVADVRSQNVVDVYRWFPLFQKLRDPAMLHSKCGRCPFNNVCGGSRARAFAMTGDIFGPEPRCIFDPYTGGDSSRQRHEPTC
ncbi:MAG: TIGR04053 family radical SAM/SPASM domain-containing protein [Dehalococcoidia bacterium]